MICPVCQINEAYHDVYYGFLPCTTCQNKQAQKKRPGKATEFTSDAIKQQRKAHWSDIHPAHRKGVPSKEFRDKWGKAAMKRQGFTDKEIKEAKNVWQGDDTYYKEDN